MCGRVVDACAQPRQAGPATGPAAASSAGARLPGQGQGPGAGDPQAAQAGARRTGAPRGGSSVVTGALGQQPPAAGPTGAGADPGDGGDGHVPDLRQLTPGGVPHDALPIDASQLTQGVDVQGVGRPGRPAAVGRIGVGGQEPARVPGELSPAGPVVLADPPPRSVVGQDLSTRPTTVGARASATGGAGIMRRVVPSVGDGVLGVGGRGGLDRPGCGGGSESMEG